MDDFELYITRKKIKLLYYLYEKLYSFVKYSSNDFRRWRVWKPTKSEKDFYVEWRGTELFSLDERIKIHTTLYKKLKPKNVNLGKNGQVLLWPIEEMV